MLDMAMGVADVRAVASLTQEDIHHRDAVGRTPFLLAVVAGDLEMARALLDHGSDLHAKGHCQDTALHLAANYDHCHLIEWLMANGMHLTVKDEFGHSALHSAVGANSVEAAALLLQKGADANERDDNGFSLIHGVSFTGDLAMLKLLLNAGANVNDVSGGGSWPLHDACGEGDPKAVSFLLNAGADPNLTSTGETALFPAVSSDCIECVRLLLDAGANLRASDCDGWSCLFHLCSERMARLLLENRADPGAADEVGGLPENWKRVPMPVRTLLKKWRIEHHQSNP
jgi:ankyrin repeat protein